MSTRSGEFVTLRDLRKEVGNDAARLFYVMRSNDQHLDFDLELAKARSNDNPVYYIQYAHARVASVMRQLQERGLTHDAAHGLARLGRLTEPQELQLIKRVSAYPEIIRAMRGAARAAHAGALPARPGERFPHLLQRASVHRRRCRRCATRGSISRSRRRP